MGVAWTKVPTPATGGGGEWFGQWESIHSEENNYCKTFPIEIESHPGDQFSSFSSSSSSLFYCYSLVSWFVGHPSETFIFISAAAATASAATLVHWY